MADSTGSNNETRANRKTALLLSFHGFSGFSFQRGRRTLGWLTWSSVPSDVDGQLEQALREAERAKAELVQMRDERARQLALAAEANEKLKAELAQASKNAEERLANSMRENQDLKEEINRLADAGEQKMAQTLRENEHLKEQLVQSVHANELEHAQDLKEIERLRALAERVSYGVR